jgi:hypothetical protein
MTPSTTILADPTEAFRRLRLAQLNPGIDRAELERLHGKVLDPVGLAADFTVVGFAAPLVVVRRKADGVVGSMEFQHEPRLYFNWQEDL